ncbi:MAG: hypothetical protein U9R25_10650 [Chloroflexota bacterium]|nr:hypothetical protein [Chloroflexota bacterium]
MKRSYLLIVVLLALGLLLVACSTPSQPAPAPATTPVECPECPDCPPAEPCPECAPCSEPEPCPEAEPCPEPDLSAVPFAEAWLASGHADAEAEAFAHWNEDDPAVVPANCAKCHSEGGYLDFLGEDGSEPGVVNEDHPVGSTVTCVACHNQSTIHKDSVVFPSGAEITGLGDEARCMECHQGRESTVSVNTAIEEAGLTEDVDTVSEELGFKNVHYYPAAATQYGTLAQGGYEYDGKAYDAKFFHVEDYNTCDSCHSSHTLEIKLAECQACHTDVESVEDFAMVRMEGSEADYDGDGNVEEGVMEEIQGLQEMLSPAIQAYATEVIGTPIVYTPTGYPYFFIDTDGDGEASQEEANYGNKYNAWSPRLLKAAYNYQLSQKDPGEFAHNGKYVIQLLYDSIDDLNQAIAEPVDLSAAARIDPGHFAGSEEAFRHWDEDGEVSASCSKCHTADGLPIFLDQGVNLSLEPSNGFNCTTCHENLDDYARYEVTEVEFPSGAVLSMADADSNLCINCHQGRAWTGTLDKATEGLPPDAVPENNLRFSNVHYFAAGATLFGDEAKGAYQYPDLEYLGKFGHVEGFQDCTDCHSTHELEVKTDSCFTCHVDVEDVADIRGPASVADYDGDGDVDEGIVGEIGTMADKLYEAMQLYSAEVVGAPIVYESHSYPYFFNDTSGDGVADPDEAIYPNAYSSWTPNLLKAAYNYQYVQKDPGAFAHNGKYVIQVLYDSLANLGEQVAVEMTGMVRP